MYQFSSLIIHAPGHLYKSSFSTKYVILFSATAHFDLAQNIIKSMFGCFMCNRRDTRYLNRYNKNAQYQCKKIGMSS